MMYHYPDLGRASDWSRHTEASDVILQETSGDVTKCQLFSQASLSLSYVFVYVQTVFAV